MRQEIVEPPGAWDLGARLLSQLIPSDEKEESPKIESKPETLPPQTQTTNNNLLTNLLSGGVLHDDAKT